MSTSPLTNKTWRRVIGDGDYLISTTVSLIDRNFVQTAFASEDTYWAKPLPHDQLETLLQNSVTLGLYQALPDERPPKSAESPDSPRTPSPTLAEQSPEELQQIGLARIITDHMTTAYLTDVYISPEYRKLGLGKWLVQCCNEIFDLHPAMRRAFLISNPGSGKSFYSRELGVWDSAEEKDHLAFMTKRFFALDANAEKQDVQ